MQMILFWSHYSICAVKFRIMFEKVDYKLEKPTESGKYFTWNEVETLNGKVLEMQTTVFDIERNKIWNTNPVKYWLKPIS